MAATLILCRKRPRGVASAVFAQTLPTQPGREMAVAAPGSEAVFDAVETWAFPSLAQAGRRLAEARSASLLLAARTYLVKAGSPPPGASKSLVFVRRRPDISRAVFERRWRGPHARLATMIPSVARYAQHCVRELPGCPALYDGVAEVWFTSDEAMASGRRTPEFEATRADEASFLDCRSTLFWLGRSRHDR